MFKNKILSTLLSFTLIVAMMPLDVFAKDNVLKLQDNEHPATSRDVTASSRTGWGIKVGIGRCHNDTFDGKSDLTTWINNYASHYYVRSEGECAYLYLEGDGLHSNEWSGYADIIKTALQDISATGPGSFLKTVNGSSMNIYSSSNATELMQALKNLGSINESLYDEWYEQQNNSKPYHPLVLCFETFSAYTGMGQTIYTCADLADTLGVTDLCTTEFPVRSSSSALLNRCIDASDVMPFTLRGTSITGSSDKISQVALYILYKNRTVFNENAIPGFAFQGMFGFYPRNSWNQLLYGTRAGGGGDAAYNLCQTNNKYLYGCHIEPIIAPETITPTGSYTWHIDAAELPDSAGYREDNSKDISPTVPSISKSCKIKDFDIAQDNYATWIRYIKEKNVSDVQVDVELYSRGTAGTVANFTSEPKEILEHPDPESNPNAVTAGNRHFTISYRPDVFSNMICKNSNSIITSGSGTSLFSETISGELYDGIVALAYATKVTVTLIHADGSSTTVPLSNNQAHFAVYGHDDGSTYKFLQILQPAHAQVKEGFLGNETYEAMAGVPTTENLFLTQGGEQWVVNMQYRYVNEDYTRAYQFKTKNEYNNGQGYPNYLYYNATPEELRKAGTNTIRMVWLNETRPNHRAYEGTYSIKNTNNPYNKTQGNKAWIDNKEAINEAQKAARRTIYGTKHMVDNENGNRIGKLEEDIDRFIASIDTNYGYTDDYDYPVCVVGNDFGDLGNQGFLDVVRHVVDKDLKKNHRAQWQRYKDIFNKVIRGNDNLAITKKNDPDFNGKNNIYGGFTRKYTKKLFKKLVKGIDYNRGVSVKGFNGLTSLRIFRFVIPLVVTGVGQDLDSPQQGMVYMIVHTSKGHNLDMHVYPTTLWHKHRSETATYRSCSCLSDCSCGSMPTITKYWRYYTSDATVPSPSQWRHSCSSNHHFQCTSWSEKGGCTGGYWYCTGSSASISGGFATFVNEVYNQTENRRQVNETWANTPATFNYSNTNPDSGKADEDISVDNEDADEEEEEEEAGVGVSSIEYESASDGSMGEVGQIVSGDTAISADSIDMQDVGNNATGWHPETNLYSDQPLVQNLVNWANGVIKRGELLPADYDIYNDLLFGKWQENKGYRADNYEVGVPGYARVCDDYITHMQNLGYMLKTVKTYYDRIPENELDTESKYIRDNLNSAADYLISMRKKVRYSLYKRKLMLAISSFIEHSLEVNAMDTATVLAVLDTVQLMTKFEPDFGDEDPYADNYSLNKYDPERQAAIDAYRNEAKVTTPDKGIWYDIGNKGSKAWGYYFYEMGKPGYGANPYGLGSTIAGSIERNIAAENPHYFHYVVNIYSDVVAVDSIKETFQTSYGNFSWPFSNPTLRTYGTAHAWPLNREATITDTEYYNVKANYQVSVGYIGFTNREEEKYLTYDKTIYQTFQNVKFMDIVDCNVWRLVGGVEKGLSSLLCTVQKNSYDPFIEMGASRRGYVMYDAKDTKEAATWTTQAETSGIQGEKRWYYESERKVNNKDNPINNLQQDGRIANSYSIQSKSLFIPEHLVKGDLVNNNEHAFRLIDSTGDKLVFEYDVGKQGGRSHWSLPGFLSQAMALTMYGSREPQDAYKNYIACQSDYLSIPIDNSGSNWCTLVGFMFNSAQCIKDNVADKNNSYGLAQSILTCTKNDFSRYWTNGGLMEPIKGGKPVKHPYWSKGTLKGKDDNKKGSGTNNSVVESGIMMKLNNLQDYQDASGQVVLDQDTVYGKYTKAQLNGIQKSDGTIAKGLNTTYCTSFLSANIKEGGSMPITGYKGDTYTSVDSHSTIYRNTASIPTEINQKQTFDPAKTLLTQGCADIEAKVTFKIPYIDSAGYLKYRNNGAPGAMINGVATTFENLGAYRSTVDTATRNKGVTTATKVLTSAPTETGQGLYESGMTITGGHYSTVATGASQEFPYFTDINLHRNLQNSTYETGHSALIYERCNNAWFNPDNNHIGYVTHISLYDGYTDADNSIYADRGRISDYTLQSSLEHGILHKADYTDTYGSVNDIIVYNPVSAQSAIIVKPGDYVSDGGNVASTSDPNLPVRNQAVNPYITTFNGSQESYISGFEPDTTQSNKGTQYYYVLRAENGSYSQLPTTCYNSSDYELDSSLESNEYSLTSGQSITAGNSGNYTITHNGDGVSKNFYIPLSLGDELQLDGNKLYVKYKTDTYSATYDDLKTAFNDFYTAHANLRPSDYDPESPSADAVEGLEINIGAGIGLNKGAVVKLSLPLDVHYTDDPVDVIWITTEGNDYNTYVHSSDGLLYEYYLEATKATHLSAIKVVFKHSNKVINFAGSMISVLPTFISEVTGSSDWHTVSTLDHDYTGAGTGDASCYNPLFGTTANKADNATDAANTVFASSPIAAPSYRISNYALDNPHRVYNANWRYYVLGWSTTDGTVITSVTDPVLSDNNVRLVCPNGVSTMSVGDLKNGRYCLVKYNDKVYLSSIDDAKNHYITSTGQLVTSFDNWSLSSNPSGGKLPLDHLAVSTGKYPLKNTTTLTTYTSSTYTTNIYEFCFNTANTDAPLFKVEYATNSAYHFSKGDTATNYFDRVCNRDADWMKVESSRPEFDVTVSTGYDAADLLSLDDEFNVYWDNIGLIKNNNANHLTECQDQLGMGWPCVANNLNGPNDVSAINTHLSAINTGKPVNEKVSDVTKWMYVKYITFDFPVYGFYNDADRYEGGTESHAYKLNRFNPTRNAYSLDSLGRPVQNNLVLIPANTRIYLGYYNADPNDADNLGEFVDFGSPGLTKDNDNKPYLYHFWSALGAGEREGAQMHAEAISINGANSNLDYSRDGYSALIWCNQNSENTNSESPLASSTRYTDAERKDSLNLVGRIGALTIIESEDPRWSDTFKYVPASSEEYLIYPLVKKITSFSNVRGQMGSQREIVLDPFDVRGRIANADILTEFKESLVGTSVEHAYDSYQVYPLPTTLNASHPESEYDTFGSQWYKDTYSATNPYGAIKGALPMKGKHNQHVPLQLTEQKIGYNLYCTLETIGNYYGTSNWNENRANGDYTNDSADYNNYKVQIRPIYTVYQGKRKNGTTYDGPVDAYMRLGSDYVMINSGSEYALDYLTCMNNSYYTYEISTNTGTGHDDDDERDLDQNMLRHSVTDKEADRTYQVLQWMNQGGSGVTNERLGTTGGSENKEIDSEDTKMTSLLTINNYRTAILGGEGTDTKYTYGNSQMLFLRERNRTFIGGDTVALNYATVTTGDPTFSETHYDVMSKYAHAQKWYFEIGLASSTLFVPSGEELTSDNVLDAGYCVCGLDVYANGNPYLLHYQSKVSECNVDVIDNEGNPISIPPESWKPNNSNYKYLIPFSYYDLSESNSTVDIDTKGSH